jgi:hypothetical protein
VNVIGADMIAVLEMARKAMVEGDAEAAVVRST